MSHPRRANERIRGRRRTPTCRSCGGNLAIKRDISNRLDLFSYSERTERVKLGESSPFLKPRHSCTHNFIWCRLQWAGLRVGTRSGSGELFIHLHLCARVSVRARVGRVFVCLCAPGIRCVFLVGQDLSRQLGHRHTAWLLRPPPFRATSCRSDNFFGI